MPTVDIIKLKHNMAGVKLSNRFISVTGMQCLTVCIAVDGNRRYSQITTGADNADCDFATIGNQHLANIFTEWSC